MTPGQPAPPPARLPFFQSIQWRLPLLVSTMVAVVFAAFVWAAFHEVEQAFRRAAGERAQAGADQLADLLGSTRQRMNELRRVAADPAVRSYLLEPTAEAHDAAAAQLRTLLTPGSQLTELWSAARVPMLKIASSPAVESTFPTDLPTTGAGVRVDQGGDHVIVSTTAVEVSDGSRPERSIGYVVVRRPVTSPGSNSDALNRLMGSGARIELGGRGGQMWTDLSRLVPAPPVDLQGSFREYRSADGDSRFGALSAVSGTPWLVWVSFPTAPVTTQARTFLRDTMLIAGLFVILAGLLSAGATSRLTRPLSALTVVSQAIAAGDYDRRAPQDRSDEMGRLGAAFNAMVDQIRDGRARLVERAQHATLLADVANALTEGGSARDVLGRCAQAMVTHLGVAHACIWTVSAVEPVLERQADAGPAARLGPVYERVPVGQLDVGRIAETRQPLITAKISSDRDLHDHVWAAREGLSAFAGYPLTVNERVVGVIAVFARAPLTERTLDALASAARAIALGIERKRLEESRAQLAGILDAAADFVTIGQPDGPPMYLNRAARHAFGLDETERVDSLMAFRSPEFKEHFDRVVLPEAEREGSWSGETEYVSRTGRVIPVSQVSVVHRDANGHVAYLSTIARDISDRRLAETALRESESRFRRIAETITEVFWIADVDLARMIYVSPGYERVWGRSCESLYRDPRSFLDAVHPDDRAQVLAALQTQRTGQVLDHEYRIIRPDGEVRWIWDRGFPVPSVGEHVQQYVGSAQDITDRRRADEQVRLLALAIESTNEMVSVTDLQDRFTFVNRAFLETYGYTIDQVLGQTTALLRPANAPRELFDEIAHETRRSGWHGEVGHRRHDGKELLVGLNTSPIRDHAGAAVGLLWVARDITAGRLLEDQLRQSQRMEAIGQLAGGIAHDFNNLLTAIRGYSDLLAESLPETDSRRDDVAQIRSAADRAASLTRQLLAFSRKQILAPRVLRLGDVVSELMPMLRRLLGEAIDLKAVIADRGSVKADTGQLEQVLVNLAVNARDAMPDGGHLTIETADVVIDRDYSRRHAGVRPGACVVLAVSDSGHGMDAATQQRVFEPFFTTKPVGQGTGLGLATVHGIVSQSGGHVWVYSEVGHGTTFKVYLPRTDEPAEAPIAPPVDARALQGHETVVLVEDEAMVREFAHRILARAGYTVHAMADPARAVAFAEAHHGPIQVVLTDVVLPGMNGRTLAGQLEEHHPECRVLYMSGYTDDAIVHHGVLEPGMWFLQKPFTAKALLTKIRELLAG